MSFGESGFEGLFRDSAHSQWVLDVMEESENTVVLTGAGISASAGVPVYRNESDKYIDPDADWWVQRKSFDNDPIRWYKKFWELYEPIHAADPTPAHLALRALVETSLVSTIVTQNVDGLDLKAGTEESRVLEVHGNDRTLNCTDEQGCGYSIATEHWLSTNDRDGDPPSCPKDGAVLKPPVGLIGDKGLPRWMGVHATQAEKAMLGADALLAIGTSFSVEPWHLYAHILSAGRNRPVIFINPGRTVADHCAHIIIPGTADVVLPALQEALDMRQEKRL